MVRLILGMVLLVAFGVFATLNFPYRTGVNLFGYRVEDTSVLLVMVISFAVGVVVALLACLSNYVSARSREHLKERRLLTREREAQLKARERDLEKLVDDRARRPAQQVAAELEVIPAQGAPRVPLLKRLWARVRGRQNVRDRGGRQPPQEQSRE